MSMIHKIYHQFAQAFFKNEQAILQDRQLNQSFASLCQNTNAQACQDLGYSNPQEGLGSLTDGEVVLLPIQNTLASFIIHTGTANLSSLGLNWMISYEFSQSSKSSIASIEICEECLHENSVAENQAQQKKLFHFILDPRFVLKSQVDRGRILVELLIQAILEFEYNFCVYSIELDAFLKRMNEDQVWQLLDSKIEKKDIGSRIPRQKFNQIQDDVLNASVKILDFMGAIQKASNENQMFDIVEQVQAHMLKNKNFFLLLDFCAKDIRNDFSYHKIYMYNLCSVPSFATPRSVIKPKTRSVGSQTRTFVSSQVYDNPAYSGHTQAKMKHFKKED
jgi:hypothetical protein